MALMIEGSCSGALETKLLLYLMNDGDFLLYLFAVLSTSWKSVDRRWRKEQEAVCAEFPLTQE